MQSFHRRLVSFLEQQCGQRDEQLWTRHSRNFSSWLRLSTRSKELRLYQQPFWRIQGSKYQHSRGFELFTERWQTRDHLQLVCILAELSGELPRSWLTSGYERFSRWRQRNNQLRFSKEKETCSPWPSYSPRSFQSWKEAELCQGWASRVAVGISITSACRSQKWRKGISQRKAFIVEHTEQKCELAPNQNSLGQWLW